MKRPKRNTAVVVTSVSLPKELFPRLEARAKSLNRNRSNYLASLVIADLSKKEEVTA